MQTPSPLVTVGIPTYNRPEGLRRTLTCITNQTYRQLEIIVSDNCSTIPEVSNVLTEFASIDKRITVHVQERNLSIVPNFQFLLDQAHGDYFMWAADDDHWDLNFIETCVTAMNGKDDVALSITDLKIVGEDQVGRKSKLDRSFGQSTVTGRSFNFIKSTAENRYFFCGLYRSSMVKDIPFPNRWGGDHLFLYEALTKGKFLFIPGQSNVYYFRGGSSKGMEGVRKAFQIKTRFYYFDAYVFRLITYQFKFRHLTFLTKLALLFVNAAAFIVNEDFTLYYLLIKKPIKFLFRKIKNLFNGHRQ